MFDAKNLLGQMLGQLGDVAGKTLNVPGQGHKGSEREAMMKGLGGGALAGMVGGLLMGSKRGRKIGGGALKLGTLAAVGTVAYKAYRSWQASQQASGTAPPAALPAPSGPRAEPELLLRAMIAAAKADGHIDTDERERIHTQIDRLGLDAQGRAFLETEIAKPLSAADIAVGVTTAEVAAEVYTLSAAIIDEQSGPERAYLNDLAAALKLPAALQQSIEKELVAPDPA